MRNKSKSLRKSLTIAAALSAAIFAASATPAAARSFAPRGPVVHSRGNVVVRGRGPVVASRNFVVPRHITSRTVVSYNPYFTRRVWVPAHNHFHFVYNFPVYTSYGLVYEPYAYCGDSLYSGYGYGPAYGPVAYGPSGYVRFGGPHFGIAFGF